MTALAHMLAYAAALCAFAAIVVIVFVDASRHDRRR